MKSITQNSAVVAWRGSRKAVFVRECLSWRWSSYPSDRNIDWATRLTRTEGVRTSHHGPRVTEEMFGG